MKRLLFLFTLLLPMVVGCQNSPSDGAAQITPSESNLPADVVGRWKGTAPIQTNVFTVKSPNASLVWAAQPVQSGQDALLQVFFFKEDGTPLTNLGLNQRLSQIGSGNIRFPGGTYYLKVASVNTQWSVQVSGTL